MARSVEEILKQQLGHLLSEIAVLTSMVESRDDEIAKLKALANVVKPEDVTVVGAKEQ